MVVFICKKIILSGNEVHPYLKGQAKSKDTERHYSKQEKLGFNYSINKQVYNTIACSLWEHSVDFCGVQFDLAEM